MKRVYICMTTALACILFPLTGAMIEGQDIQQLSEFPPLTQYVRHAGFSPIIFCILALIEIAIYTLLVRILWKNSTVTKLKTHTRRAFPWWGWTGVLLCVIFWWLAWNRWNWFNALQRHTFTPLWIGYILAVNGAVYKRSGTCPFLKNPFAYILLFPLSAGFWWFFEYLNRFVQNWHYSGISNFTSSEYICFASISFSTVLPAVITTRSLLLTLTPFKLLKSGNTTPFRHDKQVACFLLITAATSLLLIGVFPDILFPFLWVSPLLILESLLTLSGHDSLLTSLRQGDWQNIVSSAVAALFCGVFWEMWNFHSLARWEYSIPFVDRFHIFVMPILGYAGYLPFGLECTRVADIIGSTFSSKEESNPWDDL